MLKNLNDLVCNGVGDACDGSWCAVVVDAVDESGVGECDEVVGRKGGRVWVVGKFLHELEWRAVKSDSTNGMPWLEAVSMQMSAQMAHLANRLRGGVID